MLEAGTLRVLTFEAQVPEPVIDAALRDEIIPELSLLSDISHCFAARRGLAGDELRVIATVWLAGRPVPESPEVLPVGAASRDVRPLLERAQVDVLPIEVQARFTRPEEARILRVFRGPRHRRRDGCVPRRGAHRDARGRIDQRRADGLLSRRRAGRTTSSRCRPGRAGRRSSRRPAVTCAGRSSPATRLAWPATTWPTSRSSARALDPTQRSPRTRSRRIPDISRRLPCGTMADPCPPSPDSALIHARGLTKRFADFVAVDAIDFDVAKGESFGFLGPNGAGKTSTMRMIGCVSPISDGELRVLGQDPRTRGADDPRPDRRRAPAGHARHGADRSREPRPLRPILRPVAGRVRPPRRRAPRLRPAHRAPERRGRAAVAAA